MPQQGSSRTSENQLDGFMEEGLLFQDSEEERIFLSRTSICRLNAYCYVFRSTPALAGEFKSGTNLVDVIKLYEFDRDLKLLVFDAIERIETIMRKQFSDCIKNKYGDYGHLESRNFHPGFVNPRNDSQTNHREWIDRVSGIISNSNTINAIPICQLTEKMTFSLLIQGINGLNNMDKTLIATRFELKPYQIKLWLSALRLARNICSHHNRLWNQKFNALNNIRNRDREGNILDLLLIIRYLLQKIENCDRWKCAIWDLLLSIEVNEELKACMGLSEDWQEHVYWS